MHERPVQLGRSGGPAWLSHGASTARPAIRRVGASLRRSSRPRNPRRSPRLAPARRVRRGGAGRGRHEPAQVVSDTVDPTRLSDAELEAELRMRAENRDCELVVEREGGHWRAEFKQFSDRSEIAAGGAAVLSVDATERRWALERLLWLDEDRV